MCWKWNTVEWKVCPCGTQQRPTTTMLHMFEAAPQSKTIDSICCFNISIVSKNSLKKIYNFFALISFFVCVPSMQKMTVFAVFIFSIFAQLATVRHMVNSFVWANRQSGNATTKGIFYWIHSLQRRIPFFFFNSLHISFSFF